MYTTVVLHTDNSCVHWEVFFWLTEHYALIDTVFTSIINLVNTQTAERLGDATLFQYNCRCKTD